MSDEIQYPSGYGLSDLVAWGSSGIVVADEQTETAIKTPSVPDNEWCHMTIAREKAVYERLTTQGGHSAILSYHGVFESGIRVEYAQNFDVQSYIERHEVTNEQVVKWARQIAEAIRFVHQAGIIHGDITCTNVLLDRQLNAKLADFAGSSIDGSPLLVAVKSSHLYPGSSLDAQADLFAYGSALYRMASGSDPFEDLSDEEIESRFARGEFPETSSLQKLGIVIKNCWQGHYHDIGLLIADLEEGAEAA